MAIIVEDGTGVAGANSYASESTLDDYADNIATTLASGDSEAALIRATSYIDGTYRGRFPGYKTFLREQNLEWPRTGGYDIEGNLIDDDEIPHEIIEATCEAAIRELTDPGSMLPDLERGGAIQSLKAGSVAIVYAANANMETTYKSISGKLSAILIGGATSYSGRTERA